MRGNEFVGVGFGSVFGGGDEEWHLEHCFLIHRRHLRPFVVAATNREYIFSPKRLDFYLILNNWEGRGRILVEFPRNSEDYWLGLWKRKEGECINIHVSSVVRRSLIFLWLLWALNIVTRIQKINSWYVLFKNFN